MWTRVKAWFRRHVVTLEEPRLTQSKQADNNRWFGGFRWWF